MDMYEGVGPHGSDKNSVDICELTELFTSISICASGLFSILMAVMKRVLRYVKGQSCLP